MFSAISFPLKNIPVIVRTINATMINTKMACTSSSFERLKRFQVKTIKAGHKSQHDQERNDPVTDDGRYSWQEYFKIHNIFIEQYPETVTIAANMAVDFEDCFPFSEINQ